MTKSKSRKSKPTKKKAAKPDKVPLAPPSADTNVVAPTTGSCSSCFYGRLTGTVRICRVNRPVVAQGSPALTGLGWPIVADDDWCGDGVDQTSYASFSPGSTQVSQAAVPVWIAPN